MGIVSYFFLAGSQCVFLNYFCSGHVYSAFFFLINVPAIIFPLGDTGLWFIGFMIADLSLQGLKNAEAVGDSR